MMNKIAGLLAITLIGMSFILGPLSYFFSFFLPLRKYRRFLGVSGFYVTIVHAVLSYLFYYNKDAYFMLFSTKNEHLIAVYAGALALLYFFAMTFTSFPWWVRYLGARKWKTLQSLGYAAFAVAMAHFILAETNNGVFIIRRPFGKALFVFGCIVLLARISVFLVQKFKTNPPKRSTLS